METTMTETTTTTRPDLRDNYMAALASKLMAAGYKVKVDTFNIFIDHDGLRLGSVDFYSMHETYTTPRILTGTVMFNPEIRGYGRHQNRGRYTSKNGVINEKGLMARIAKEIPVVRAANARAAKWVAREQADAATYVAVTGLPYDVDDSIEPRPVLPKHVENVRVFDGKVSVKLTGLTPEQARAVLRLVSQ